MMPKAIVVLACLLWSCASVKNKPTGVMINENTEWSNTWIVNTKDTKLPKVLLIGDSHVERYYPVVTGKLGAAVSCSKFTTSKSLGDPAFIKQLESVLMLCNFDVIAFNNGLHGVDYNIEAYLTSAQIVHAMLKKNARKSVVWINSTAIREKDNIAVFGVRNQQIVERNKFLYDFTKANNIALVDFYAATADKLDFYTSDGVHFNQTGVNMEAALITQKISEILALR